MLWHKLCMFSLELHEHESTYTREKVNAEESTKVPLGCRGASQRNFVTVHPNGWLYMCICHLDDNTRNMAYNGHREMLQMPV